MIVVHAEYRYAPTAGDAMRSLVLNVEHFSRGFDGCHSFALSFPVDRPGILLGTEVWADPASLRAHVAVAHDAAELNRGTGWSTGWTRHCSSASDLSLEELQAGGVAG